MSNKQFMAGGLACATTADDPFALEPLESRTFLSGNQAGVAYPVMVASISTRQDVMPLDRGEMANHFPGERLRLEHHESTFSTHGGGFERPMQYASAGATLFQVSIAVGRITVREVGFRVNHGTDRALPGTHGSQTPVSAPPSDGTYEPDGDASAIPIVNAPRQPGSAAPQVVKSSTKVLDRTDAGTAISRAIASTTVVTAPAIRFTALGLSTPAADVVRDAKPGITVTPVSMRASRPVERLESALQATAGLTAVAASQSMRWLENVSSGSAPAPVTEALNQTPETHTSATMIERLASMVLPRRVFNFTRLGDPLTMLNDPLASFVDESASSSATVIGAAAGSSTAWSVTSAVIAADVVLLTYMYRKGRRSRRRLDLSSTWGPTC